MIREAKDINFSTTGRQPSEKEFEKVSEWIRLRKEKLKKKQSAAKKEKQKN